jgi:hypothetical protein
VPNAEWVTGCRSVIDEAGCTVAIEPARNWSAEHYLLGDYKWIQQESTYWKRSLWERVGGGPSKEYKLAGDYALWLKYFTKARLYATDALIGGFRVRTEAQASLDRMGEYEKEIGVAIAKEIFPEILMENAKKIKSRKKTLSLLKGVGKDTIYQNWISPLYSNAPRIYFDRVSQKFTIRNED